MKNKKILWGILGLFGVILLVFLIKKYFFSENDEIEIIETPKNKTLPALGIGKPNTITAAQMDMGRTPSLILSGVNPIVDNKPDTITVKLPNKGIVTIPNSITALKRYLKIK